MKIRLIDDWSARLTFQDYAPAPEIEGVYCLPLKKHVALEGSFMEHLRMIEGRVEGLPHPFEVRQISFSRSEPQRVNAFHLHPKEVQNELWTVIQGVLKVWLVDVRGDSPTSGVRRCYVLNGEAPGLLHIPSGVAHGYKAGREGALLVYAMDSQFNLADPNEGRLPWDGFGADLWDEDRG